MPLISLVNLCIVVRRRESDASGPLLSYEEFQSWPALIQSLEGSGISSIGTIARGITNTRHTSYISKYPEFIGMGTRGPLLARVHYNVEVVDEAAREALCFISMEELKASRGPITRPELPRYALPTAPANPAE